MTGKLTDERWQAIIYSDSTYDDVFIYAVKSTRIFCRPSCKSRIPKKENVHIFDDVKQALAEGFRPCKRCKPAGLHFPDEEWVIQIREYIDAHYNEQLSLARLAEVCHGSSYHLQRVFKRISGISPVEYIQQVRISKALQELRITEKTIEEIGVKVGLPNTSYFITLFKRKMGQTPKQYRRAYMEVRDNGK